MSRLVGRPVPVVCARDGTPALVGGVEVLHIHDTFREWIGALEGRGEVDVWRVETHRGLVELHFDRGARAWTLAREED